MHTYKVDLYGFGIMVWEMFTGKLPWSDKNYHQMIHTVLLRVAPRVDMTCGRTETTTR